MAYVLVNWFFFLTVLWSKVKESEVTQSCLTLCNPVDYSLPGSFGHEIFQARILEWVAMLCFEFNVSRVQNALLRFTQKDKTLPNPEFVISHEPDFPPIFSISVMAVPSANPLNKGTGSYSDGLVHTILLPAPYSSGLQLCWFWHLTMSWKGSFFFRFTSSPLVEALIISHHCFSIIKG